MMRTAKQEIAPRTAARIDGLVRSLRRFRVGQLVADIVPALPVELRIMGRLLEAEQRQRGR